MDEVTIPDTHTLVDEVSNARLRVLCEEVRRNFGPVVARSTRRYLRSLAIGQGRESISQMESEVLIQFEKCCNELSSVTAGLEFSPGAHAVFLSDIFEGMLEKEAGKEQKKLVLRATVCPDFSFDEAKGIFLPDGRVSGGVGKVGKDILLALKPLTSLLVSYGIEVLLDFCYADIEADDLEILKIARLTKEQFVAVVSQSREMMNDFARREFQQSGINATVVATSMKEQLATVSKLSVPSEISEAKAKGLVSFRLSFYYRFYKEGIRQASSVENYLINRAQTAISQHINVGQLILEDRRKGVRVTLVTGSVKPLVKYFKVSPDLVVPVIRVVMSE